LFLSPFFWKASSPLLVEKQGFPFLIFFPIVGGALAAWEENLRNNPPKKDPFPTSRCGTFHSFSDWRLLLLESALLCFFFNAQLFSLGDSKGKKRDWPLRATSPLFLGYGPCSPLVLSFFFGSSFPVPPLFPRKPLPSPREFELSSNCFSLGNDPPFYAKGHSKVCFPFPPQR